MYLLNLVDEIVLFVFAGILVGMLPTFRKAWLWALALGFAVSAIRLSLSRNWFAPDTDLVTYFWAYSEYYVPPLAAVLGALVVTRLRTGRSRSMGWSGR